MDINAAAPLLVGGRLAPPVAGPLGVVALRYGPAEGLPRTGDMTTED